jgi:hypothetical protein
VHGRALLVEELALDPVGVALQRHRPAAQVRQQDLGEVGVGVDQVALGEADRGIEDLGEVGDGQLAILDPEARFLLVDRLGGGGDAGAAIRSGRAGRRCFSRAALAVPGADQQPLPRPPPGRVEARLLLHHQPVNPLTGARREQLLDLRGRVGRDPPGVAFQLQPFEQFAAAFVGRVDQVLTVEEEQVEDHVGRRVLLGATADRAVGAVLVARRQPLAVRPPLAVEDDDFAVEDRVVGADLAAQPVHLRPASADLLALRPAQVEPPRPAAGDRPHPAPGQLRRPAADRGRQHALVRQHRQDRVRIWIAVAFGRVHPVDHPVLRPARLEEHVAPPHPPAFEAEDDLVVAPLLQLVGAAVPDRHRAGPVLALRDLALEGHVLERVVLGVDGLAVFARVERDAVRHRPGGGDALVLQPQVPVQAGRVVLLDDEARRALALAAALARRRLLRLAEVPFAFVLTQLRHLRCRPYPSAPLGNFAG